MLKVLQRLQKSTDFWVIFGSSVLFFLFRFPSFFEPYWYGDEGIYEVIGYALTHGRFLYQGIWDNKPPLLYLIYAIGSGDQATAKVMSCIVGLCALFILFAISKKLFTQKKSQYIAVFLFTFLFGLPFLEGNIANAENFMVLPSMGAAYLVVLLATKNKYLQITKKNLGMLFLAGFLLGLSFLIKVVAVFDATAFGVLFIILAFGSLKKDFYSLIKSLLSFSVGFIFPILLIVLFFASHGLLKTFLQSAFFNNVGYVNYGNQFIIPQGLLIAKILLLAGTLLFLLIKRNSFSMPQLFILIWLSFTVFDAFFSQRPYTHYLLVLVPTLCFFIALLFDKQSPRSIGINTLLLIVLLAVLGKNFWFYGKIIPYYDNFAAYLTGQKDAQSYQAFFDKVVPRDYALSEFIKSHTSSSDTVFIWGNSGQIYKLVNKLPPGRFIVAYHITTSPQTLLETSNALKQHSPKFVIILPNASAYPFTMGSYTEREEIDGGIIYEQIL